jgi:hypothetical protein
MTAGDRFKVWIEGLSTAWGAQLGKWAAGFVMGGIEGIADKIGEKASMQLQTTIAELEKGGIPPVLQPIIGELKSPTGEISALSGIGFLNRVVGSIKGDIFEYFTRSLTHGMSYSADFYLPRPELLLSNYLLGISPDKDDLYDKMRSHGIPPEATDKILASMKTLYPSDIVASAWLRDKAKYGQYWDDVYKVMGLDKNLRPDQMRIELLQELAYKIPGVQDIIRYVVKEAYSPEIYKTFGQDQEYPSIAEADAEKTGVRPDQLMKEWISHWDLPSVGQGFEMLHRGIITQEQLTLLLKAKDIMPFWRDKLTDISWTLPGRIEVRMMAQLGLVDKDYIKDILRKDGLAEEYLDDIADMNIVRGIRSDIQTRYTKGWLNSDGVLTELTASGLSPQVVDRLYQWIVKNVKPERTATERNLTTAEIVKGVKKGIIDWSDGTERLMALGYDEDEAAYIMAINIEAVVEEPTSTITVQTDTIRRQRRQRLISKEDEVAQLIYIRLDPALAQAYADNDDLRLVKAPAEET